MAIFTFTFIWEQRTFFTVIRYYNFTVFSIAYFRNACIIFTFWVFFAIFSFTFNNFAIKMFAINWFIRNIMAIFSNTFFAFIYFTFVRIWRIGRTFAFSFMTGFSKSFAFFSIIIIFRIFILATRAIRISLFFWCFQSSFCFRSKKFRLKSM